LNSAVSCLLHVHARSDEVGGFSLCSSSLLKADKNHNLQLMFRPGACKMCSFKRFLLNQNNPKINLVKDTRNQSLAIGGLWNVTCQECLEKSRPSPSSWLQLHVTEFLVWPEKWILMRSKNSGITYWVKPMELERLTKLAVVLIGRVSYA